GTNDSPPENVGVYAGHFSLLAPHRKLVAVGIGEVETTTARKLKRFAHDSSTGTLNLVVGFFQILGVKHDQNACRLASARDLGFSIESAAEAAVVKAGVPGSVVGEIPAKDLVIEALGCFHVSRGELDVIHVEILVFAHGPPRGTG